MTDQPTLLYRQPDPRELPGIVCIDCGVLVFDRTAHDNFHIRQRPPIRPWAVPVVLVDPDKCYHPEA